MGNEPTRKLERGAYTKIGEKRVPGNTWNFRDDLERNGIAGARASEEGGAYYRFLKNVDVSDSAGQQRILSLCDIFKKNRQSDVSLIQRLKTARPSLSSRTTFGNLHVSILHE